MTNQPNQPYGSFAYVYDRLMSDMPYGEWLGWLDAYWEAHGRPSSIVDLGCGTGTISLPLAGAGYRVVGIDISENMLAVAKRKEASARSGMPFAGSIDWECQDMRSWSLREPADAVISLCDCMNYLLSGDDLLRTFQRACGGLAPGGTLLFDMHHSNQLQEYMDNEPFCYDDDDVSYIWNCDWDRETDTITHKLSLFIPDGEHYVKVKETHRQRAYPEAVIRRLLDEAGFSQVDSFADFSFEPVSDDSTLRMFFAARKPA